MASDADKFHGDTFRVGWLNSGEKTGDAWVDPILIGKGLKYLGFVETLGKQGFNNLFEGLGHDASPSDVVGNRTITQLLTGSFTRSQKKLKIVEVKTH